MGGRHVQIVFAVVMSPPSIIQSALFFCRFSGHGRRFIDNLRARQHRQIAWKTVGGNSCNLSLLPYEMLVGEKERKVLPLPDRAHRTSTVKVISILHKIFLAHRGAVIRAAFCFREKSLFAFCYMSELTSRCSLTTACCLINPTWQTIQI